MIITFSQISTVLLSSENVRKKKKRKFPILLAEGESTIIILQSHKCTSLLECMFITGAVPVLDV